MEERQATFNNQLIEEMRKGNTQNAIETYNNLMTQSAQDQCYFIRFILSHLKICINPLLHLLPINNCVYCNFCVIL